MIRSYPENVTRQPNGAYTWRCPIEVEFYRKSISPGLYVCVAMALILLITGGVIAYMEDDLVVFLILAGCAAVFLLIALVAFGVAFSAKNPHERYLMTEGFIRAGTGRSAVLFAFRKARILAIGRKYIELHGKIQRIRVYIPEKDYDFVRGYVRSRVPMECEIKYV